MSAKSAAGLTISEAIKRDHRDLERFYENFGKCAGDLKAQQQWANQFIWENARHAGRIAEEIVVYPYMEKHLPNGPEMTENDRFHHQEIKNRLATLQNTNLEKEPGLYQQHFNELFQKLSDHVGHEEAEDLTALEAAIGHEESLRLADEFQRIKKFLPTRSITQAPNHPDDGQTLAAFMAKPVTAIADMFRTFPKYPDAKL